MTTEHWVTTWNAGVADDQVRDVPGPRHPYATAGVVRDAVAWEGSTWREITPRRYVTLELLRALVGDTRAALVVDGGTVVAWANAYWLGARPGFDDAIVFPLSST